MKINTGGINKNGIIITYEGHADGYSVAFVENTGNDRYAVQNFVKKGHTFVDADEMIPDECKLFVSFSTMSALREALNEFLGEPEPSQYQDLRRHLDDMRRIVFEPIKTEYKEVKND